MGKRRSKSENYISKGEHSNVARRWIKTCRMGRAEGERIDAQWKAFKQGKRVILTVKNPNKNQTNKPFIKVNAKEYWKSSRKEND